MYNRTECSDGLLGPKVASDACRGGFDFTLAFEETVLTILPAVIFILASCPRMYYLFRSKDQTGRQSTYTTKLITCGLYASLQIAQLAVVATANSVNTKFTVATAAVNVVAAFFVIVLSHAEHVKTIRPSFMIFSYLFLSLIFDGARLRTEWLITVNGAYASLLSTSFAIKTSILLLESVEKRDILLNKINPPSNESTSGPISRGFFLWLNSLLLSGWATVLTNNDLPAIYERLSSPKLSLRFNTMWENALRRRAKPSLFLSTVWTIKWDILAAAMPRLAAVALTICRPLLISSALDYLNMAESSTKTNIGYGLIAAFALVFVGSAIMTAWYEHLLFRAAGMVRGGLITLVYRKMLRLPVTGLSETSAVSLMGNDIETLAERSGMLFVECWANLITVIISLWMLSQQLGAVCVVPILLALISLFGCTALGKTLASRQIIWQKATQDRINFISEVIGSIKAVKMLGFSDKFTESIREKRINDIARGKKYRWMIVWLNGISNANESLTQVATFGAFAIVAKVKGETTIFSGTQAITTLSILGVLAFPLAELLGCIAPAFGTLACFKRVEDFLILPERRDARMVQGQRVLPASESDLNISEDIPMKDLNAERSGRAGSVAIVDGNFKWGEKEVLTDINTSVPETDGSLTVIVGPIGCGKSSLLKSILGETEIDSGVISLSHPDVAFCDQTPWIMDASIRENIVGESHDHDGVWYTTVVDACDLREDLDQLPEGDATLVGDKGLKLSGGQKQRIAVARAVFARKKIAMFDDVFSGLDKVTERNVFTKVFSKEGLLHRNGTTTILATHSVHHLVDSDYVIALAKSGRIIEQGTYERLQVTGSYVKGLNVAEPYSSDEEDDGEAEERESHNDIEPALAKAASNTVDAEEDKKLASDRSTFKYYFLSMGKIGLGLILFTVVGSGTLQNMRSVWVSWWGDGLGHSSNDLGYWLGIFVFLAVADVTFIMASIASAIVLAGPNAGMALHERLLNSVMRAPMSILANVESGSLVNRFSQDMRFVDMVLPVAVSIFLMDASMAIGALGIAVAAVKWLAIVTPIVLLLLVLVQRFYVRTSKQLRLLEIENKAPMYGHFLESIHGLATIRAFGWVDQYAAKNMRLLDEAQKPWYLLNCIQRWLTLVLDLIVAIVIVVMMAIAVAIRDKINPSLLGVALVQMSNLGLALKGIIIQWSTLETSLGAVTRIKTFVDNTPSEHLLSEDHQPPQDWLSRGVLDVQNAAIQYSESAGPVVRNVTFSIKSGEKIGLCGRSGSGKSSTIQALVRMADVSDGRIILDGQDITQIPRQLIREKLSCLTQEPILFTNTIRFNADPLQEHTDEEITSALKRVGIWDVILAKTAGEDDILGQRMSESFLSHGQRQLFCLGRALLKKSSILILDEPTSSVDNHTDAAIQAIIRSEFKGRTILMIAHRLDTLLDFDRIAVLEKGRLVEFDTPKALLNNKNSCFSALYRADNRRNA